MPHKTWKHTCSASRGQEIITGGEFAGWGYSLVEAMGAYQRRTGLKPIGPHRSLADAKMDERFKDCPTCAGTGLVEDADEENAHTCLTCHGEQYLFDGTPEELKALRAQIRKEYPTA